MNVLTDVQPLSLGSPFKRRQLRRFGSSDYDGLDVSTFLRALGVKRISRNARTGEVWYSCPGPQHKRGDLHPSASMNEATTQFFCNCCSDEFHDGNAATFLAAFLRVTIGELISTSEATKRIYARDYFGQNIKRPRERKTKRASGSLDELHERTAFARQLLDKGASYTKTVNALILYFGISRRTAERDVSNAKGLSLPGIVEVDGKTKVVNRRRMNAAKLALRMSHKEIAMEYQIVLPTPSSSGILEVDGKHEWDEGLSATENINRIFNNDFKAMAETEQANRAYRRERDEAWRELRTAAWSDYAWGKIDAAEYCKRVVPKA